MSWPVCCVAACHDQSVVLWHVMTSLLCCRWPLPAQKLEMQTMQPKSINVLETCNLNIYCRVIEVHSHDHCCLLFCSITYIPLTCTTSVASSAQYTSNCLIHSVSCIWLKFHGYPTFIHFFLFQLKNIETTRLPILLDMVCSHIPEGVSISVKEVVLSSMFTQ